MSSEDVSVHVVGRNQPFQHREDPKLLSLLGEIKQNVVVVVVYGALFLATSKAQCAVQKDVANKKQKDKN